MSKVYISPAAESDLHEINDYITKDLDNPTAAKKILSQIMKRIRGLREFPDKGVPLSTTIEILTDYRFLTCKGYLVFYRKDDDFVYILRILYSGRDYMKILFGDIAENDDK